MNKWDIRGLRLAREISSWSLDPSTKVGCYIADAKHMPVSFGFNGFPRGIADDDRLNDREVKYQIIVHAEANAILNAARDMQGATAYVYPFMPCAQCASFLIQKGIHRVVSIPNTNPRWVESFKLTEALLAEAGIGMVLLSPESLD